MKMDLALNKLAAAPVSIALESRHMRFRIEVVFVGPVRGKRESFELTHDLREDLA
ncbi:hypothetical protein [Paraburkholderia hospita]|uniref:hypothetical protein n=1 Tax=Paraburkholderia hospita TaxID=169430 RepID=UPI003B75C2D2